MRMWTKVWPAAALVLVLVLGGCAWNSKESGNGPAEAAMTEPAAPADHLHSASSDDAAEQAAEEAAAVEESGAPQKPVTVELINTKGGKIGSATLVQGKDGVLIKLEASHLTPGAHGFHIHQKAVCEAPNFTSAGEHFNPDGHEHGYLNANGYHAGDLPNLMVGADGQAKADFYTNKVTLEHGKPNSLLKPDGTSLVIHEKADDYKTNPAGDAGARIACGAIKG